MPSKQEPRLMLLAALMLFIIAIFFPFSAVKRNVQPKTVRPRNLKLSQLVDLNLRRTYQSLSQISP